MVMIDGQGQGEQMKGGVASELRQGSVDCRCQSVRTSCRVAHYSSVMPSSLWACALASDVLLGVAVLVGERALRIAATMVL